MSNRLILARLVLPLALMATLGSSAAAAQSYPPGLDAAELNRARSCSIVERVFQQGQEVGLALQDSLVLVDALARRIAENPEFVSGSTPDGRAFLIFTSGQDAAMRTDTLRAGGDIFPLLNNFVTWRRNNQTAIAATEPTVATQLAQRRSDLLAFVSSRGREMLEQYQSLPALLNDIQVRGQMCTADVALLKPAVIQTCDDQDLSTMICQAARADTTIGTVRFVGTVDEIWTIRETMPWTTHDPLTTQDDVVTGGSVGTSSRVGNALIEIAVTPLLRRKANLTPDELADFQLALDSLGISFSNPEFAMVPAMQIRTNITSPLSAETYYLLHTGTVDGGQAIQSFQAGQGNLIGTQFVLSPALRTLISSGEPISFTAVNVVNEETLSPIWSVPLSPEGGAAALAGLLAYYGSAFSADVTVAAAASTTPITGRGGN